MKTFIKFLVGIVIAGGLLGYFGYYYINKPKQSIINKEADIIISPQKLLEDFTADEQQANSKYLDKIIEVSGKVAAKNIDQNKKVSILLDTGDPISNVTCELSKDQAEKSTAFEEGSFIEVKGKCTGILTDVVLVDCVILTDLNN